MNIDYRQLRVAYDNARQEVADWRGMAERLERELARVETRNAFLEDYVASRSNGSPVPGDVHKSRADRAERDLGFALDDLRIAKRKLRQLSNELLRYDAKLASVTKLKDEEIKALETRRREQVEFVEQQSKLRILSNYNEHKKVVTELELLAETRKKALELVIKQLDLGYETNFDWEERYASEAAIGRKSDDAPKGPLHKRAYVRTTRARAS